MFDCKTDTYLGTFNNEYPLCPCDPTQASKLQSRTDGSFKPNTATQTYYNCTDGVCPTSEPEPEVCKGTDNKDGSPATPQDTNEGCGDDEYKCTAAWNDRDGAPIRFSSGRVESNPITLLTLTAPHDLFFGYRLLYNSHVVRVPAIKRTVHGIADPQPTIHHMTETTDFRGYGWLDNFSDRLFINVRHKAISTITWQHMDGIVTFTSANGWKSKANKFEIIDRGASPADGFGRWVIRTTDTSKPREIWSFDEETFKDYGSSTVNWTIGRLRRRAVLTSDHTNLTGQYGFTVDWTSFGTLDKVVDSLGRELVFEYATSATLQRRLAKLWYRPAASATQTQIAEFRMAEDNMRLDKVDRIITPANYTRFLYMANPPAGCRNCTALLTAVISKANATQSPAIGAALLAGEVPVEENWYGPASAFSSKTYVGVRSRYPGREYAYEHTFTGTTQFDITQPGPSCGSGCPQGMACKITNNPVGSAGNCYVADSMTNDAPTRLPTMRSSAGGGSGNPMAMSRTYAASGAPRSSVGPAGDTTTFGFDTSGRVRCIVRDDDDSEAFASPGSPNSSSCAGPSGSQIVKLDYNSGCTDGFSTCTQTTTPSVLSGNVVEEQNADSTSLLPVRTKTTGMTRDIDGTQTSETHITTTNYDSLGRATERNGPLTDSVALDKVTTTYHAYSAGDPYAVGHVHQVTRYVGTSSSNTPLTTTYSEYDINGVARKVTGPNGDFMHLETTDGLTWTIKHKVGTTTYTTTTVQANADGTVRSVVDPDSICLTYEYSNGLLSKVRRANASSACGTVPINVNSQEVEVRTYFNGDPRRLQSITRKLDGVTHFSYSFSASDYDRDRRLVTAPTVHAGSPFTFNYTDVLQTGSTAPGAPAAGTWRTDSTVDSFARPTSLLRFVDGTNKLTHNFSFASAFAPRPTTMTRGYNGASTSVTTFAYDDFGRLLEAVVPEAGAPGDPKPTRYEYDVAGRMTKKRLGVGTALVRTSVHTYDSLDRTLAVDNDIEHPVDCSSAPAGTPIQDEEYKYDDCTGDVPSGFACANALGRVTIARSVLQCGTIGTPVRRGRWYDYTSIGKLNRIAYATVTGTSIGAPAITLHEYTTTNGRLTSISSPLSAYFGTQYVMDLNSGRPKEVWRYSDPVEIASGGQYRAFGPLSEMTTGIAPGGGLAPLKYAATFASDDSLTSQRWYMADSINGDIDLQNQTLARTPVGVISTRTDSADHYTSRHYSFDALLRLTCEARGDTSAPSSSDCAITSSRLAGLFTYGNGESATSPPDVRLSSFLRSDPNQQTSKYVSDSVETSSYSSGSGQIEGVNRTGSSLVIGYDALGRRTHDYDSSASTISRRDYTYLPNGQLGSIVSRDRDDNGAEIEFALRYDEEGRPLTISQYHSTQGAQDTYELFWDDASRLSAAAITFPAERDCGTVNCTGIRWHYHYLDERLVAASREILSASPWWETYKLFWAVTDERGLVHRLVDNEGATYWQARWDASGWGTWVGTPQPEMWVPFGLPGQIVLGAVRRKAATNWGTEAANASGSSATARPPIALNQWRAYDPFTGAFLQSDGFDLEGRLAPEGYIATRNNSLLFADPSGSSSEMTLRYEASQIDMDFASNCSAKQMAEVRVEAAKAYYELATCSARMCSSSVIRRAWLNAFGTQKIYCNAHDDWQLNTVSGGLINKNGKKAGARSGFYKFWTAGDEDYSILAMSALSYKQHDVFGNRTCLANQIAHETAHHMMKQNWFGNLIALELNGLPWDRDPDEQGFLYTSTAIYTYEEEFEISLTLKECPLCP